MTTGRINQVNIVSKVKRHRNWKQTISNKQAHRTQINTRSENNSTQTHIARSTPSCYHLPIRIHRSLRRKTKTQIEALHISQYSTPYSTRKKANRNQTETAKRASPILSALPEAQVSPHNNNSANQFNFILQNWISFPKALTHNFHPPAIRTHTISKADWTAHEETKQHKVHNKTPRSVDIQRRNTRTTECFAHRAASKQIHEYSHARATHGLHGAGATQTAQHKMRQL
jgi:hypothetical protein